MRHATRGHVEPRCEWCRAKHHKRHQSFRPNWRYGGRHSGTSVGRFGSGIRQNHASMFLQLRVRSLSSAIRSGELLSVLHLRRSALCGGTWSVHGTPGGLLRSSAAPADISCRSSRTASTSISTLITRVVSTAACRTFFFAHSFVVGPINALVCAVRARRQLTWDTDNCTGHSRCGERGICVDLLVAEQESHWD